MPSPRFRIFPALAILSLVLLSASSTVWASKLVKQTPLDTSKVPQFADELTDFSAIGRVNGDAPYSVRAEEFQQKVLPASFYAKLPAPYSSGTMVFGYGVDQGSKHYPPLPRKGSYPGYTVVVTRNHETVADYHNNLVAKPDAPGQFRNSRGPSLEETVTIDQAIHWADPMHAPMQIDGKGNSTPYLGALPAVTHLHGAEDPSAYDGGPSQWFTPGAEGKHGDGNRKGFRGAGFVSSTYHYPNAQEPTTLWFHDHTLGLTRTNVFAGLAAFYLIRGDGDDGVPGAGKLPAGRQEVELVLQDRQFDTNGQLLFPDGYPPGLDGKVQEPTIHPYWMPEFFGDVIMVNGKAWPKFHVAARRYRLRFLDGASTRFFNLQFCANSSGGVHDAHTACTSGETNAPFYVIGDDGGLLDAPARVTHLLFSPGERYDVIVDFTHFHGKTIMLRNDAVTPYPSAFAKFTPSLQGRVMRIFVADNASADDSYDPGRGGPLRGPGSTVAPALGKIDQLPGTNGGVALGARVADGKAVQVYRQLTLNPIFGSGGCHWPGSGETDVIDSMLLNNSSFHDPATETPRVGATEVWDLIDLSNDDHPIHIHLVQFQVIKRIPFDLQRYGAAYYAAFPHDRCEPGKGPPHAYSVPNAAHALGGNPDITPFFLSKTQAYCMDDGAYDGTDGPARPEERGWKDTVIASCGHVTRIVVRFTPQDVAAVKGGRAIDYTGKNLFPFDPSAGPGYVWHCHLIDHEDNDMMRPMIPQL
ncbi:MAG: multicopper oxidase domain-containing protein [Candidatus Cybelea sp.]